MDIHTTLDSGLPVLTLEGRLDGFGADVFDATVASLASDAAWWVVDLAEVPYVSSIGIRSLTALEKSLRLRSGGVVLAAPTGFVRQVLRISHLDTWFHSAPSRAEAVALARGAGAAGPAAACVVADRPATLRSLAGSGSTIEWWGQDRATENVSLVGTTLDMLGYAFGHAGVAEGRSDGRAALGAFIGTPVFAGTLPSHGAADFIVGASADAVPLQVASALSIQGEPAFRVDVAANGTTALTSVLDALFDLIAREGKETPPAIGVVSLAANADAAGGLVHVALVVDPARAFGGFDADGHLRDWPDQHVLGSGRVLLGAGVTTTAWRAAGDAAGLTDALRHIATPDALDRLSAGDDARPVNHVTCWVFVPASLQSGAARLLQIAVEGDGEWRPEWDAIVRRLYADCGSVTLTPLHGGYMSKTFRAVAYDRDGRRLLPTVVKLGSTALTAREEQANRQYVARFILNNGTTVLGGARDGEWAGLRYNFLGVNGPDSRLVWLREHYQTRPTADVVRLFETLLTQVLKPWYGQPRWEQTWLYRDHTPLRLFPNLLEVAERELGIAPDSATMHVPELGTDLPNPFHFLKHVFPERAQTSRLWYTTVCHGDLNLQNVLVDERENLYVIDFSETHPRNAVADFARLEPILKFELLALESDDELARLVEWEAGLMSVTRSNEPLPFAYRGTNPSVAHAHAVIALLRRCADTVTLFEHDLVPYWIAMLEWTYSPVCYVQLSPRQKRYAAISAALLVRAIERAQAD